MDLDGLSDGSEGDFMSEAKDWAGELISGQTGAGKMLVSQLNIFLGWTMAKGKKSKKDLDSDVE